MPPMARLNKLTRDNATFNSDYEMLVLLRAQQPLVA